MLVATRDPMLQPGPHDPSRPPRDHRDGMRADPANAPPRSARFASMLQIAGSLMAIPVGLASAYSIYKANFSPDTQCQALRTSIIAMIDKKIDASTRRMLVRHDVEAFEKSCGNFDPDAKAAFVTLLAAEPRTVPVHAAPVAKAEPPKVEPKAEAAKMEAVKAEPAKTDAIKAELAKSEPAKAQALKKEAAKTEAAKTEAARAEPVKSESVKAEPRTETQAKEAARKAEPRPAPVKQAAAPAAPEADATVSDDRWLDAVRGALVSHEAARETAAAVEAPVAARVATPDFRGSIKAGNATAPQPVALAPAPQAAVPARQAPVQDAAAPALPPATSIGPELAPAAPPAQARREVDADPDHPVPPGSIPDGSQPDDKAAADAGQQGDSRFSWVSKIPVLGPVLK
jgi:hypothetical protein